MRTVAQRWGGPEAGIYLCAQLDFCHATLERILWRVAVVLNLDRAKCLETQFVSKLVPRVGFWQGWENPADATVEAIHII